MNIQNQKGLTLIELMVALVLATLVVGAVYNAFISQQKAYTIQEQVAEMHANARHALEMITRDVRMAGFGVPAGNPYVFKSTQDVVNTGSTDLITIWANIGTVAEVTVDKNSGDT
ncbi:MAG: prepilin-type N-terminal cleavage/methylation domain-containing protein [Deltaproteobacteria bacterium]|nr:prepilin-type N-terminal cleavage/methylation domain-containing protein [Deltaproteobacteria bacterium]